MIKFGPSGNCESFYAEGFSHTEEAAAFVKKRGLDCFEYSFGRGVRMSEDKAISIGEAFQKEGVEIVHEVNMGDDRVMFIHDCNGVLIELIQKPE